MQIKIKALNNKTVDVLYKYSKMKQRGVSNIWDSKDNVLIMTFPKLSDVERLKPFYIDFIETTLKDNHFLKNGSDYEVIVK